MYVFIFLINPIKSIEKYQFIIDEIQNEITLKMKKKKIMILTIIIMLNILIIKLKKFNYN